MIIGHPKMTLERSELGALLEDSGGYCLSIAPNSQDE